LAFRHGEPRRPCFFITFQPPDRSLSLRLMTISTIHPLSSLSPEDKILLRQGTDSRLREIICANIATRFASSLVDFRLAVANKDLKDDATILDDFRRLVPLTEYESYHPLLMKFKERPCKLSEVENLLTPGLPDFLCESSATSGREFKVFPKRSQTVHDQVVTDISGKAVDVYSITHRDLLQVVTDSGEAVHMIPLTASSTARWRTTMNWTIETDDARMGSIGTCPVAFNEWSRTSYFSSSWPCCSMGHWPHCAPSALPVDSCAVCTCGSACRSIPCAIYTHFHGHCTYHTSRVGSTSVQHSRWNHSRC